MDQKTQASPQARDLSLSISDIGSRLRVLEERYANLRKKTQITDQNLIETEKGMMKELEELNQQVMDLKHGLFEINEKITTMLGELSNCVKEYDFNVYAKYIELWEPANFITKNEVGRKDL
ncbi:MAG: hypothetical protein ABIJ21_02355 [Nanoarchaeota archaeon]